MESRESIKALLDHASAISSPGDGAPRVLLVFSQMAAGACDWLDGELRVELVEAEDVTVIECMTDLGGGYRERVFAPIVMRAPLDEFRRATTVPEMITPLIVKSARTRRLVLVAEPIADLPSMVAPAIEIGKDNLFQPSSTGLRAVPKVSEASVLSRSSAAMRAVRAVAVPAPAPMPTFLGVEAETAMAEIDETPAPPTRPDMQAIGEATDAPPSAATRTMIPAGLGAPPPPPIVEAKKRDSQRHVGKYSRRPARPDPRRDEDAGPESGSGGRDTIEMTVTTGASGEDTRATKRAPSKPASAPSAHAPPGPDTSVKPRRKTSP